MSAPVPLSRGRYSVVSTVDGLPRAIVVRASAPRRDAISVLSLHRDNGCGWGEGSCTRMARRFLRALVADTSYTTIKQTLASDAGFADYRRSSVFRCDCVPYAREGFALGGFVRERRTR